MGVGTSSSEVSGGSIEEMGDQPGWMKEFGQIIELLGLDTYVHINRGMEDTYLVSTFRG
jgi:hypothetical protein